MLSSNESVTAQSAVSRPVASEDTNPVDEEDSGTHQVWTSSALAKKTAD